MSSRSPSTHSTHSIPLPPQPPLQYRWLHAGAQHLDLLATPITSTALTYTSFSERENTRLEAAWWALSEEERAKYGPRGGKGCGEEATEKGKEGEVREADEIKDGDKVVEKVGESSAAGGMGFGGGLGGVNPRGSTLSNRSKRKSMVEDLETIHGVPVSQDALFEVSLPTLSLSPVFWAHSGPRVPVLRAGWFFEGGQPCEWSLGEELEQGYGIIKPYLPSYPSELQTATTLPSPALDKLRHPLTPGALAQSLSALPLTPSAAASAYGGTTVIYLGEDSAEIVWSGVGSYLSKMFWTSLRARNTGMMVYRGWEAALAAGGKAEGEGRRRSRRGSEASVRSGEGGEGREGRGSRRGSEVNPERMKKSKLNEFPFASGSSQPEAGSSVPGPKQPLGNLAEKVTDTAEDITSNIRSATTTAGGNSRTALEEEQVPVADEEDDDECSDLILVIHGIGQQLAAQYEGFNFVYAANVLRNVMRTQSQNAALASIIRNRRVQVLPIQWRASLELDQENDEEDEVHEMNNRFTMADITLPKIPVIRQLTNSVLLDIPLFMSHHRGAMIEAVCYQANRAYRLWCARNPGFDGRGRVHLIGHSLGSALAACILSDQPTKMPPMSQLPRQVISSTRNQFLFNTSNLFLCGSPLGIFLHLDQAQIMPRKGRERTMHSPQDEALDRSGRFGCMSCDSIYNIVHLSDPIAYTLNATVDAKIAKDRPPLPITSVTAPFYATVTDRLPSISQYLPAIPYLGGSPNGSPKPDKEIKPKRRLMVRLPSGIEMSGPEGEERLQGSRGERRLSALNPHGNIDFVLPSGGVSEYLDALTSHASYWSDPNFGAFLLAEIYSTKLDLLRTGMGLATTGTIPEGIPL